MSTESVAWRKYGLSRREWLAATAAGLAFTGTARGAEVFDPNVPRNHACIDWPPADVKADVFVQADTSPAEAAILEQSGKLDAVASAAPMGTAAAAAVSSAIAKGGPRRAPARAAYISSWSHLVGKKLLVYFLKEGTDSLHQEVLGIASQWCKYANIDFERTNTPNQADIRVGFSPSRGHYSYVGKQSKEVTVDRTMNLGIRAVSDDYSRFVILHEFGHALGCIHEHQREDQPPVFNETAVINYFVSSGKLPNADSVRSNIIERVRDKIIAKSDTVDTKSIMHYPLPAWMFKDGKERLQNYDLSPLDKRFAALMYQGRIDPDDPSLKGGEPGTQSKGKNEPQAEAVKTLALDRGSVEGKVYAGKAATFKLNVPAGTGTVTIYTEGSTQVVLQLSDGESQSLANDKLLDHGTYDLTNDVLLAKVGSGDYVLSVAHASPRGGGRFRLSAVSGDVFKGRLLDSNPRR